MKIGDKSLQWVVAVAVVQAFLVGLLFLGEATGVTNILSPTETRIVCPGATFIEGEQGEQGEQGLPGPSGPQGATGPQGETGEQGEQGEQGDKGKPGQQGAQGPTGQDGATGPEGQTGPAGQDGATGAAGPAGQTGATGPPGDKGETGATGAPGATGTPGATGAPGPQGDTGATGPAGEKGDPGECPSIHGSYLDTTTQTATANTPTAMTLDSTVTELGVSIEGGTRITVAQSGVYNIQFSAQISHTSNAAEQADIWLNINGVPVSNSNTTVYLEKGEARYVAAWNFMVRLAAGDYAELMWYTSTGGVRLLQVAATAGRPAIPSLILTVDQVASP